MAASLDEPRGLLPSQLFSRLGEAIPHNVLDNLGRYTRFVDRVKLFLLAGVILLIGIASAIFLYNTRDNSGVRIVFSNIPVGRAERPLMLSPKFEGVDKKDQPYTVTASQAAQTTVDGITYTQMQNINADLWQKDGGWINITADNGTLSMKQNLLSLDGHVTLYLGAGYTWVTPKAMVNLNTKQAYGNQTISGEGPSGTLQAQQYFLDQDKQYARFEQNVRVRIFPGAMKKTSQPNP